MYILIIFYFLKSIWSTAEWLQAYEQLLQKSNLTARQPRRLHITLCI